MPTRNVMVDTLWELYDPGDGYLCGGSDFTLAPEI